MKISKVVEKVMIVCETCEYHVFDDFPEVRKIVGAGLTNKPIKDYEILRYVCYLIVYNGDLRVYYNVAKEVRTAIGILMPEDCRNWRKWCKRLIKCYEYNI